MFEHLKTATLMLLVFSILTGLAYPLAITGVAQLVFPHQANGSLILKDGAPVGSELIGQPFTGPEYFWSRPSSTSPAPYNAGASSGSNLAVTNPVQLAAIQDRVARLRESGAHADRQIPIDLVTASGSGLDPHISVEAARFQAPRVARARGLSDSTVADLITGATELRQFGILGEPRVNVLLLNLALDLRSSETRAASQVSFLTRE